MEWITRYGPPHLTWLIAATLVQRERQRWHHRVARPVYEGDSDDGEMPGLPGWTFYRHGNGVCLMAPDGEVLDVDYNDDDGAVIDIWFFAKRIESLAKAPNWLAELRLWHWRPSGDVIVDGFDELIAAGAVTYETQYKNKIILVPELEARAAAVTEELRDPASHERWLAALEPGGPAAHLDEHRAWVRRRLAEADKPGRFLDVAFRDSSVDDVVEIGDAMLQRRDWAAGHAIELLRARRDVPVDRVAASIVRFLQRSKLEEDHPFSPYQACRYLFDRGVETELALAQLDRWSMLDQAAGYNGNPMASELAILALEHAPDRALRLIRRALRKGSPMCVSEVAGLLALVDQPWCHRELISALAEPEHSSRAYLAAALRATSSDLAARRADNAPGPPPRGPDAVGYTFEEVLHANADTWLGDELDGKRELAAQLRERYPADWNG